ncbi:N-acetylmuramoyl-L-alanine amidase domain protein [Synechococcus sp. PCC 7335]|uniref:N-acetylmuramoyl-L-alanine amidase n=1 Tax=Synechococcus sp. (strain ATCC 29403 / PCC 7335) TaxID=91464 RepID=UPI00017ED5A7|nr:N-acetylmuramoyl-L-alanine amidase [Synechococcus sp. PCC 7335]EDX85354.1 N-acetylmuramoyl-L-alanine amidase domain protein [Synechococcus sp. PCC 7335]
MGVFGDRNQLSIFWSLIGLVALYSPREAIAQSYQGTEITQSPLQSPPGSLFVAYPPLEHQTVADRIFFIGTADPSKPVTINGQAIQNRSEDGHFAPTLPLEFGENIVTLAQGDQKLTLKINRVSTEPVLPDGTDFAEGSLTPAEDIARLPGEVICLSAIAPTDAVVSATLGDQTITLAPQSNVELPPNSSVLTDQIEPISSATNSRATEYAGCTAFEHTGHLGTPRFTLSSEGNTVTADAPGQVNILSSTSLDVAEVTAAQGVARVGPSTSYSRITPLPAGTRAAITGREGEWLRLDYGGWIKAAETAVSSASIPPTSIMRGITARQVEDWTEVIFPLQTTVPITITQDTQSLSLTLHNTTPQTDTIYFSDDPVVERMDFHPLLTNSAEFVFHFKEPQQWGYKTRYEGTSLILSLRHAPPGDRLSDRLGGTTILLDPGHGSSEDLGARGPTGYPEKDVTLIVSKLLRDELENRGASVVMTREGDDDLFPRDRVEVIDATEPTMALSIHYNALPDAGDALNTAGIGTFWYYPQAHDLATFLHDYLVDNLGRESYGVFWNNLALTRPSVTPSVLLELGFMINPEEFEWITDEAAQKELAKTLADGVQAWIENQS